MGAIVDPDELANVQSQLAVPGKSAPAPSGMGVIAPQSGAIVDPGELEHARTQLSAPKSSAPAAMPDRGPIPRVSGAPRPTGDGSSIGPMPDRGIGGTIEDGIRMLVAPLMGNRAAAALDTVTGTGLPNADYAKNLANETAKTEWAQGQHPYASQVLGGAGTVGAGLGAMAAAPEEGVLGSATLAGRSLYNLLTGGVLGGTNAASAEKDLTAPGVIPRVSLGAGTGAAMGAVSPIAGSMLGSAYSGAANAIGGGAPGISRPVTNQIVRSLGAQGVGNTQAELDRLGPLAMLADTGEPLRAKTQGAAIYNPEGRAIVSTALKTRDEGTDARLKADTISAFGATPQTPLQIDASIKALRSFEHSALPQIFANAPPVDTSNVLATIGQGLTKAVGPEAAVLGKARDYLMQKTTNAQGSTVLAPIDDAERIQNAKAAIDMLIDRGDASLGIPPGAVSKAQGAIGAVRAQLNQELRNQVPGYDAVMDRSSALARKADAIEVGYKEILGGGKSALNPQDLNDKLAAAAKKGPEVLEGYRIGLRAAIDREAGTSGNDLVALRKIVMGDGDWNRSNMSSIMGAGPTNDFVESIDRNTAFRNTRSSIMAGAKSAETNQSLNELKPNAGNDRVPFFNPNATFSGQASTIASYPFRKAWQMMGDQLRSDPYASHGELARVLTAQGPQRDAYYSALVDALTRRNAHAATGQAIGNNAAMAAALLGSPPAARLLGGQLQSNR